MPGNVRSPRNGCWPDRPGRAVSLILLASLPLTSPAFPADPKTYQEDVNYLLREFEAQAGKFFKLKGIDWKAVEKQFRAEVKAVKSDEEHLRLCSRLLARLKDGHAGITDSKVKAPDESAGRRWTGPRVHLVIISGRVYVRAAFKDAETQGVRAGMEVVKIDGAPALRWLERKAAEMREKGSGYSTDQQALYAACHWGLADWEGTKITFELRDLKGGKKTVGLVRRGGPNFAPFGPAFPPPDLKTIGRQSYGRTAGGYAYLHLRDVPADLPDQLGKMLAEIGEAPGLILDLRANGGGGCDHEAVFGRFLAPGEKWRQYTGAPPGGGTTAQGDHNFTGPLVVIVDAGVRSAGETVAGMLKEDGRAYAIGDGPTAGTSSQKATLTVPSGLFTVRFSIHSNKARFNDGKGIEGIGVPPNEVVPYDPAELGRGVDTQIRRAEELLKKGFPKGAVAYPGKK